MKKLLTILLTLLMVFTLVGCNSTKEEEPVVVDTPQINEPVQEEIVGGFIDVEDGTLTDELKDIFNKAIDGLLGATYEPIELVATQVVAGTNYKFLANGTKTTNPITKGTYYIYVNKDLQGNVSLLDIETIEEKQEEAPKQDVTQMSFWVVFYDQYGNELQRETLVYGSTPSYKGYLPDGFVKWTYKKTGKDVNTFVPITTNTYFKAVCNHVSAPANPEPTPTPTPIPVCENTSTYLIRITSNEGSGSYKYDVYKFNSATNSYIRVESEKSGIFDPGYSISLGNYYHSEYKDSFDDLGKLTLCEHVNTHSLKLSEEYTVTFDLNGITGTEPTAQTIEEGGKVTKPADPTDMVHTFAGWYKTKDATTGALSGPWDFDNDTVTESMTLYAKWTRTLESIYTGSDIPKVTDNTPPDNAWVNGKGGKAFIAFSANNSVLFLKGTEYLTCKKTENFTKIGDDYVLDYYIQSNFYGKYTLHMTEGIFTSVTYNGAGTDYEALTGTYIAPVEVTFIPDVGGTVKDSNGNAVTNIFVPSGATFSVDGSTITIGGIEYTAAPEEGFEFDSFSFIPNSGTITTNTAISVNFSQSQP